MGTQLYGLYGVFLWVHSITCWSRLRCTSFMALSSSARSLLSFTAARAACVEKRGEVSGGDEGRGVGLRGEGR